MYFLLLFISEYLILIIVTIINQHVIHCSRWNVNYCWKRGGGVLHYLVELFPLHQWNVKFKICYYEVVCLKWAYNRVIGYIYILGTGMKTCSGQNEQLLVCRMSPSKTLFPTFSSSYSFTCENHMWFHSYVVHYLHHEL